jgi:2,4-dienoyl-CoA reductase-like NADH-dependent reductase (Old Yellow Enzyme family)
VPSLFDATTLGAVQLKNRFVRSATWEGLAGDDGSATGPLIDMYAGLAEGGVGLIITGHAYVSREGQACVRQIGIHDDAMLPGLARLTDAVHRRGGAIAIQLAHAGCRGAVSLTGVEPVGPVVMTGDQGQLCRKMRANSRTGFADDFARVAGDFANAAARAEKAGFDAVQVHGAHSYLLSQFLSPCHNTRTDGYGGSVRNRARFLLEVLASVREATKPGFAILVKINSDDFIDGGFSPDEMIEVAKYLEEKEAVDAIEMSGGSPFSPKYMSFRPGPIRTEAEEVYYREAATRYKQTVSVPLILPGGIRSYSVAQGLVEQDVTDYVSMSRPLIREPGLINRWKAGDTRKATCLSDNQCTAPLRSGEGLYCVVERKMRDKAAG